MIKIPKEENTIVYIGRDFVDEFWDHTEYELNLNTLIVMDNRMDDMEHFIIREYLHSEDVEEIIIALASMGEYGALVIANSGGDISVYGEAGFKKKYGYELPFDLER